MTSVASGLQSGSSKRSGDAARLNIHNKFCAIALLAILLFIPTAGFAQAISGDLTGAITDPSGAAIPAATIVATNDATGVKTTTLTNATGVYRFSNLPVGRYTLTGSAAGFTTATVNGLDVTLGNVLTANLTLPVGAVGTTVEVTSALQVNSAGLEQIARSGALNGRYCDANGAPPCA